jgi:hypothetical protein
VNEDRLVWQYESHLHAFVPTFAAEVVEMGKAVIIVIVLHVLVTSSQTRERCVTLLYDWIV